MGNEPFQPKIPRFCNKGEPVHVNLSIFFVLAAITSFTGSGRCKSIIDVL